MVTNQQVRYVMNQISMGKTIKMAAMKSGMDRKTARKYIYLKSLPSEIKKDHVWQTRSDPFKEEWIWVQDQLTINPGLEAKTLFEELQRQNPGKFEDGQLRTLQRRVKEWRHLEGPDQEIYFEQIHYPGDLCSSDFTHMDELGITINLEPFKHLIYHFTLTYSNWETGTVCFSESIESLGEGLQNAWFELGGVTKRHRTDQLSAAVHKIKNREEFISSYKALLNHYGVQGETTQAASPHENGDIESLNGKFKRKVGQALMLRGSRDFGSRKEYEQFLSKLFKQINSGRQTKFLEEMSYLKPLPSTRLNSLKEFRVNVGPSSTINILHNTYSVPSRLIGAEVKVKLYAEYLELSYGRNVSEIIPRVRGEYKYLIQYRHIIEWLIRKPHAFENYRYRDALYPTTYFRMAYDELHERMASIKADKEYLKILYLAAKENEAKVNDALKEMITTTRNIEYSIIEEMVKQNDGMTKIDDVKIEEVDVAIYDSLLMTEEA